MAEVGERSMHTASIIERKDIQALFLIFIIVSYFFFLRKNTVSNNKETR